MNKSIIIGTAIIAVGIVVAAIVSDGRYTLTQLDQNTVIRMDKWTGAVSLCGYWEDNTFYCVSGDGWTYKDPPTKISK